MFAWGCLSTGDCFFDARRKATGRGSVKSLRNLLSDRCDGAALHMYKERLRVATRVRDVARSAFGAVRLDGLRRARGGSAKMKQKLSKSDYRKPLESGPDFANAFQEAKDGVAEAGDVYSDYAGAIGSRNEAACLLGRRVGRPAGSNRAEFVRGVAG